MGGFLSAPGASAAPKPTIPQVQQRIEQLQEQAEVASEQYNTTREQLASLNVRVRAAQAQVTEQRRQVAAARVLLGRLAAETYRRGTLSALEYVFSDDPEAALTQAGLLPSLGERQVGAARRLAQREKRLAAAEADLRRQRAQVAAATVKLTKQRSEIVARMEQATAELNKLKAEERAALLARQRARERAALLAARRRAAAESSSSGSSGDSGGTGGDSGSGSSSGGTATCQGLAVNAPTSRVRAVLEFACAQLGEPYEWGAAGPDSWDCSGFTMKSWAQAGVSLPHSSAMQADYGTRVSYSQLRPGDLVFFYSPIHHVGIYLGDGLMIHAPHTGDVVRVAAMRDDMTAAVRL